MEEEDRPIPGLDELRALMHASNRPQITTKTTPNGHSISTGKVITDNEKKVNPLKIRLGSKLHPKYGITLKPKIISNAQNIVKMPGKTSHLAEYNTVLPSTLKTKVARKSINDLLNSTDNIKGRNVLSKKIKPVKGEHLKEYAQSLGLQPTVKFKCRKCSSMSFKSLVMLKEHQRQCKAQSATGEEDNSATNAITESGRVTKKVFICSSCSTYYESWNLFLHMRQVHNRHICLYCLGMFSKAERLTSHLFLKHGVIQQNFKDREAVEANIGNMLYLTCCTCEKLFTEKDDYIAHSCLSPRSIESSDTNENISAIPSCNVSFDSNCIEVKTEKELHPINDENTSETSVKSPKVESVPDLNSSSLCLDTSVDMSVQSNESRDNESSLSESISEETPSAEIQNKTLPPESIEADSQYKNLSEATNHESDSASSDDLDDSSSLCIDSPKHENNNISNDKVKEVGIKLKLSLSSASSPVIINSTVRPDQEKPLIRPNRPPGGRIVAPGEPIPPPAPIQSNVLTTIYDNKSEELTTLNRVPKLTVRVPKGLLDKDSSSDESSSSDVSDKLTVDDTVIPDSKETIPETADKPPQETKPPTVNECFTDLDPSPRSEIPNNSLVQTSEAAVEEEIPATEITLDRPLDKYHLKELLKVCVMGTMYYCVYCNHVRKIAVNCKQLALHMLNTHRFRATVNSITAEELLPETIKQKIRMEFEEVQTIFVNLDTYDSVDPIKLLPYVRTYECFQCYFITTVHKDLYFHNRKMHQKTILLCVMCKSNFYSYSELLCHLCPGTYDPEYEIKFRCCMCNMDNIPSAFRLMVHIRKVHNACDVCTEMCDTQSLLSTHVWKHKLHHLCYRCGIAYRNKADITKHLFWKHGTESVMCKRCLQKKWPHVYHFCVPPISFICEECNEAFTKAVSLKVHKRFHSETYPHACSKEGCSEKFVSKKLLAKHMIKHHEPKMEESSINQQENSETTTENKEDVTKILSENDTEFKKEEKSDLIKVECESLEASKKIKKKKNKDSFLLDVNLPALNLSESDSSDESDTTSAVTKMEEKPKVETEKEESDKIQLSDLILDEKAEEKDTDQTALDIWDNFKQYQAKLEKQKTPPLTVIRKHVCESDHDYCLIPNDTNGDSFANDYIDKEYKKKSPRKKLNKMKTGSSSSSSSSSSSDSCCSRGSKCSCSSSSGSSSSSSSDSDSSNSLRDSPKKMVKVRLNRRRDSNRSHSSVDVMAVEEQAPLVPEKKASPIPESDLETTETDTDEEFYDKHPQHLANKIHSEKKNQLMLLASVAPSDNGSITGDLSRPVTPEKVKSPKKKHKTKKRKKATKSKHEPIKLNIPKDVIRQSGQTLTSSLNPNKLTISLHSNSVQNPIASKLMTSTPLSTSQENKRASKRRRVPNKFYGYSSDEETVAKSQPPMRNEFRKREEEQPPLLYAAKPQPTVSLKIRNYNEPIRRMSTPIPDPIPPPILMNNEHVESSDTSSDEYGLKIDHESVSHDAGPVPSPYATGSGSGYLAANFTPPAGARQAREGENVYCYCRCPYDEVSEMIACDAVGCAIEWFHFECVGIMVPPKGKWYCPECRERLGFT